MIMAIVQVMANVIPALQRAIMRRCVVHPLLTATRAKVARLNYKKASLFLD